MRKINFICAMQQWKAVVTLRRRNSSLVSILRSWRKLSFMQFTIENMSATNAVEENKYHEIISIFGMSHFLMGLLIAFYEGKYRTLMIRKTR